MIICISIITIFSLIALVIGFNSIQTNNEKDDESTLKVTSDPFLWRIEGENPSYLYGSIHVKTEEILTLPDVVMDAINEVDVVYTESKLDNDSKTESLYSHFRSIEELLENILPPDIANNLNSYLITKNSSITRFNFYSIWAVSMNINSIEYQEYFLNPILDQYIWDIATEKGKETKGLETASDLSGIYNNLTLDEQFQHLNDTLTRLSLNINESRTKMEKLIDTYISGDLDTFFELTYENYDKNDQLYEKLFNELITNRNYDFSQNITDIIKNNQDKQYFFTIGAAHYGGEKGIINLLEQEGFTITKVNFDECNCEICDDGQEKINGRCYIPYT